MKKIAKWQMFLFFGSLMLLGGFLHTFVFYFIQRNPVPGRWASEQVSRPDRSGDWFNNKDRHEKAGEPMAIHPAHVSVAREDSVTIPVTPPNYSPGENVSESEGRPCCWPNNATATKHFVLNDDGPEKSYWDVKPGDDIEYLISPGWTLTWRHHGQLDDLDIFFKVSRPDGSTYWQNAYEAINNGRMLALRVRRHPGKIGGMRIEIEATRSSK